MVEIEGQMIYIEVFLPLAFWRSFRFKAGIGLLPDR
jgi:hypothetical protein